MSLTETHGQHYFPAGAGRCVEIWKTPALPRRGQQKIIVKEDILVCQKVKEISL